MKITIVILHDMDNAEHFVGAVEGMITHTRQLALAQQYNAVVGSDLAEADEEENTRALYFQEVDLHQTSDQMTELLNIDGSDTGRHIESLQG